MELHSAIRRLSALAQESRLSIFRMLVKAGPEGVAAGDISRDVGIPPNTCSSHLSQLANAGLIRSRRDGRSIIYSAAYDGMTELLAFLMEDCCQGRPEVCAPLTQIATAAACCDSQGPAQ